MIVADSNLIAYLLIPGNKSAMADAVFLKDSEWAVPLICRSEIRNILAVYMRHKQMSLPQARATMEQAERLWREREFSVPSNDVLELTHQHDVTAYDGEFVVLARALDVPLVTFDRTVRKLFPGVAMHPADFLKR